MKDIASRISKDIASLILKLNPHSTKSMCKWSPQRSSITYAHTKVARNKQANTGKLSNGQNLIFTSSVKTELSLSA